MIKRGEKNFLSKFLILARINESNFNIKQKHFSALDTIKHCGSMPVSFQRKNREFIFKKNNISYELDKELPLKVEAFQAFTELCVSNNIYLFIVYSPNFYNHNISFENRIKELSYPQISSIFYDTTNSAFKDEDYFHDRAHLKTNGAVIFTNQIISELKSKASIYNKVYKN